MQISRTKHDVGSRQIRRVTNLAIGTNIMLFVVKLLAGLIGNSVALIADGIHSLSDMTTDIAVLFGLRLSSKKADEKHPYGHGRAETFSAGFIALVLIIVGAVMIRHASFGIARGHIKTPHTAVLVVAVFSIVAKEFLYRVTKKVAFKFHSPAAYANAWHHRSDAISSMAVLAGLAAQKFGFIYGDHIAAIAVGLMIILVGVKILGGCFGEFAERAVDRSTMEHIKNIISQDPSIRQWHKLRTRTVGREVFVDLHILVEPELNIAQAHEIAENLETSLHRQLSRPVNITVHIEPDRPELRK